MKRAFLCWAALFLLLAASSFARAADLTAKVAGHPNLTYFDLLRRALPDLTLSKDGSATGHKTIPFDHLDGKDAKVDPPDPITLASVEAISIPDDKIVLLADLGQPEDSTSSASLLILFALTPSVTLLDIKEVGSDRFIGFRDKQPGLLGKATPLILVDSSHFNSNQNYNSTDMILIRDNRFRAIDSVFTFNDGSCSYTRTQEPTFLLKPAPDPYRAIDVRVREHVELTKQDCGDETPPPAKDTIYEATYRWDASKQRFVASSAALDELAKEDQKRF